MKSTYTAAIPLMMMPLLTLAIPASEPITSPIDTDNKANSSVSLAPVSSAGITLGIIEKSRFTRTPPHHFITS
ncbi:MAG: hypothetical protein BWY85_01052 [Firmicutes bacterium ADurb.Bin506]|nr:MAG: hypothetical protein BWY85_01052 [Firmicutes bacterium ADurb.Bin506]